jgi:hypothetical protein
MVVFILSPNSRKVAAYAPDLDPCSFIVPVQSYCFYSSSASSPNRFKRGKHKTFSQLRKVNVIDEYL